MQSFERFHWSSATESEQLAMAQKGNTKQLRVLARKYDWALYPETVLGWIMAQKYIDLTTALAVFLNGDPERFNYLPKRSVPKTYRGAARVLDNICQRVNCGFYLYEPGPTLRRRTRLEKWLEFQAADREEGRQGRWTLEPSIVEAVLKIQLRTVPEVPSSRASTSDPWKRLVESVA